MQQKELSGRRQNDRCQVRGPHQPVLLEGLILSSQLRLVAELAERGLGPLSPVLQRLVELRVVRGNYEEALS